MRIGVDARALVGEKAGIGHYIAALLGILGEIDCGNEYYLYSPRPFETDWSQGSFRKRVIPARRTLWWVQKTLPRALVEDKIDLFWGGNYSIPLWPEQVKKVVTVHDLVFHKHPRTLPLRRLVHLRAALPVYVRRAHRILVVSKHTAQDLREIYGVPPDKIVVTHLAARSEFSETIAEEAVEAVLEKYGLPRGYLLYVGTVEPRKGVDTILKALALYRKRKGKSTLLVVAGLIGWKASFIEDLVEQLSLEESVRFLHYVPDTDLPALYRGASVFLYPSLYEGFGLPVLEAMASGVPVITSRVAALPEVGGAAALYIEPGDADCLTVHLEKLLADPGLREQLSEAGRKRAALFSWRDTAYRTLKVFKEVVEL